MIAESLAGKRIAITGSTGFVGTALVERLLRCVPGCELVLLVRDGRRTPAARRVQRELLKNDAFDRLRAEHGAAFDDWAGARITTVAGDVGTDGLGLADADRDILASCDIVIDSAATVSFDSPLDSAVEINLLGPTRIVQLLNDLGVTPHVVSVSTCYVAGNRRGNASRGARQRRPLRPRVRAGKPRSPRLPAARRLRGGQPRAGQARRVPGRRPHGARRRRSPGPGGEDRAAPRRWVRHRLVEAGRAAPPASAGPTPTPSRRRSASRR